MERTSWEECQLEDILTGKSPRTCLVLETNYLLLLSFSFFIFNSFCCKKIAETYISLISAEELGIKEILPAYLDPNLQPEDLITGINFASGSGGYDPLTSEVAVLNSYFPEKLTIKLFFCLSTVTDCYHSDKMPECSVTVKAACIV